MKHRLVPGIVSSLALILLFPTVILPRAVAAFEGSSLGHRAKYEQTQQQPTQRTPTSSSISQEIRRINSRIAVH